jgi:hypothetical protein
MLDSLQPSIPLSMSDLSGCHFQAVAPKLLIRALNVGDLFPKTPNLVPKNL